ncbi:MAG TPA: ABC transporter substrate-binding protein [Rhodocyclaceae bacterium]|nr:ABC transporter substrate-binding protein [Rhodocyclaceae bacterium]
MKRLLGLMASLFLVGGLPGPAAAQSADLAPDVLVKNVTNEVLDIVRKDKDIQNGNTKKAIDLVETKVLPYFNFNRMTALAVGKDWRQASPAQQKQLADEFHTLLVRTYSKALTEYRSQTISFKPLKAQAGDTDVTVRSQINQPGAKAIDLDYSLEKGDKGWKVYDIAVGGVSLVTNYRSEFAQQISQGGIDGLIKRLQTKNKSGEASVPSK